MGEKKRFSKKLKTVDIEIENEKGEVENWQLREIHGPQRDQFLKMRETCVEGDKLKPETMSCLMGKLISMSLFDSENKPMDEAAALMLPSDTQIDLFEEAVAISGLDRRAKEAAKNGLAANGGSGTVSPNGSVTSLSPTA